MTRGLVSSAHRSRQVETTARSTGLGPARRVDKGGARRLPVWLEARHQAWKPRVAEVTETTEDRMGNANAIRVGSQAGAGAGAGHHGTVVEGELCRVDRQQSPKSLRLLSASAHPSRGVLPSQTPPATCILNLPNLPPSRSTYSCWHQPLWSIHATWS